MQFVCNVCMYVCMCACMRVCMHLFMNVVYARVQLRMERVCVMHVCLYVCNVCMYVCMCVFNVFVIWCDVAPCVAMLYLYVPMRVCA